MRPRSILALLMVTISLAVTACGSGSEPPGMDPVRQAEYRKIQGQLEEVSTVVRGVSAWTMVSLDGLAASGHLTAKQHHEFEKIVVLLPALTDAAADCAAFTSTSVEVYGIGDTELSLAEACLSTLRAFRPVADALSNERLPSASRVEVFRNAASQVWDQAENLGYTEPEVGEAPRSASPSASSSVALSSQSEGLSAEPEKLRTIAQDVFRISGRLLEGEPFYWLTAEGRAELKDMHERLEPIRVVLVLLQYSGDPTSRDKRLVEAIMNHAVATDELMKAMLGRGPSKAHLRRFDTTHEKAHAEFDRF